MTKIDKQSLYGAAKVMSRFKKIPCLKIVAITVIFSRYRMRTFALPESRLGAGVTNMTTVKSAKN